MLACQVDAQVFKHLVQSEFPSVSARLRELEVDLASVTLHWFLCLFVNALPAESCLRLWDVLFLEAAPVPLFRAALALVDLYSLPLLETSESSDAYMLLQALPAMTLDASRLVHTACLGHRAVGDGALQALRLKYRRGALSGLAEVFDEEEEEED
ncbi:hypothetical protein H632_c5342p0, partial [Helicosporidium sp. ATCC 50920]